MSQPAEPLINGFCTDEDIATRFRGDFVLLCDREYMAQGTDGVFAANAQWAMTSASNIFDSQGVASGSVIQLKTASNTTYGSAGMLFAVDSAVGSTANLRRLNQAALLGLPPGPVAGLAGVQFIVPTLAAQIENASYDIERRYGISDFIYGRRQCDMWDPREVRDVTILTVVWKRMLDLARQADNDVYYRKAQTVKQDLDDLLSRVTVHWINVPLPVQETTKFTTRLSR